MNKITETDYAPVAITTLNRYEHFRRCLESLERCTDSEFTDVYIALDYPPSERYVDGWKKIDEYLISKEANNGFRNLIVIRRDRNYGVGGLNNNFRVLIRDLQKTYSRYIESEDDNEFSPCFLQFMNWGLNTFKDDKSYYAVCAYNLIPSELSGPNNVYRTERGYCAWGIGRWAYKDKMLDELLKPENFKKYVEDRTFYTKDLAFTHSFLCMLKNNSEIGDVVGCLLPDGERYCLFPKVSMVRNWGRDGSGIHGGTKKDNFLQISEPIETSETFIPSIKGELGSEAIEAAYKRKQRYKITRYSIVRRITLVLYKLTGKIVIFSRPDWMK